MNDTKLRIFEQEQDWLRNVAYRMVGTLGEAEDMVQETWLRWSTQSQPVASPRAWLSKTITRLCIDHLKSARVRREEYVGPWLPEPIPTGAGGWMTDRTELADSLSHAMLHMMERLSPSERAAFLLREVFDYDYGDVAGILGETQANCRQMVHRAKTRVRRDRSRFEAAPEHQQRMLQAFGHAVEAGEMEELLNLFHQDITFYSDGGGKAIAALRPVQGADKVARFFLGLRRKMGEGITVSSELVNGEIGLVARNQDQVAFVMTLEMDGHNIIAIRSMRNPDKLAAFHH